MAADPKPHEVEPRMSGYGGTWVCERCGRPLSDPVHEVADGR